MGRAKPGAAAGRRDRTRGASGGKCSGDAAALARELAARSPALSLAAVEGDGNCLFRALALWHTGGADAHSAIRAAVVDELRARPDAYAPFLLEEEGFKTLDA
jgi:hypothetical protein